LKKPVKLIILALIIIVIAALIIVPKLFSTKEQTGSNQKQSQNQQDQVISAEAFVLSSKTLDNEIKAIGTIRANEEVEIRSEVSRKISAINFKEGSHVAKGQQLFKLDADDLTAKFNKLLIEEKLAISKFNREKQLLEKGLTSQEEYDISENTLENIRADMSITRIDIQKTSIRAPFSGIVGLRNVSRGSYVSPQTVLVTMQDVSKVKIDFSVPEKYLGLFKKGQVLSFNVEGVDGTFDAEVYAYEPKIENNTRSLLLRALCSNPKGKLYPGTFADVKLKISELNEAIMIPTQGLVPKLKGQSVYILRNGRAKLIEVEIGERTEDMIQIISENIASGDTIVVTNILRLKNDSPVKIVKVQNQ
jgi:membrane fusion protein, multidrug efflux system